MEQTNQTFSGHEKDKAVMQHKKGYKQFYQGLEALPFLFVVCQYHMQGLKVVLNFCS